MKDVYVEWLVPRKRSLTDNIIRVTAVLMTVACGVLWLLSLNTLIFIVTLVLGVITFFAFNRTDVEYEYIYVNGELGIDRILAKSRRKRIATFDTGRVEIIAPLNSYHLDGHKHKKYRELDFTSGIRTENSHIFVMYYAEGKKVLLEPNRELMTALKGELPLKVHIES